MRYIKEDDKSTSDGLKDDCNVENKSGGDNADTADEDVIVKSKHDAVSKDNDDNSDIKEKSEVHKKGSKMSQHFWEVWRRYSEFELLRNFLQAVYPHVSCWVNVVLGCLYAL